MADAACAVGRLAAGGVWIGFAPGHQEEYLLAVGGDRGSPAGDGPRVAAASVDDLLSLAIAYFEDALAEPPEELAATHADIGALVRHLASLESSGARREALLGAVDAVDDGLAPDVVVGRLAACLEDGEEPVARLERRATELIAG